MKNFLLKLSLFLLPILGVSLLLEVLLRNIPNDYLVKKHFLESDDVSKIQTFILGNSHSYYGVNPEYFSDSAFNAAYISQSLSYDWKVFNRYQDKMLDLKRVFIPVSYLSLYGALEKGKEAWRVKNYVLYYKFNAANSINDHFELLSNNLDINLKRIGSYYLKHKTPLTTSRYGWGTDYNSQKAKNLYETGKTAAIRHTRGNLDLPENILSFTENVSALKNIVAVCKKRNIEVILFTPPAFVAYRQHLDSVQMSRTEGIARQIAAENTNCKYLNLLDAPTFIAGDYYDGDHLSEIGAKKLSLILSSVK